MSTRLLPHIVILWVSLAAHEIAHCQALALLGDPTPAEEGRRSLSPHRHLSFWGSLVVPAALLLLTSGSLLVMWAKPVHYRSGSMTVREPFATTLVKLAGPAANALIATVAWAALALLPHDIPLLAWRTLVAVLEVNVVLLRIPVQADHPFRPKPISDSARSRSLIPEQADHPFRPQADHFRPSGRDRI